MRGERAVLTDLPGQASQPSRRPCCLAQALLLDFRSSSLCPMSLPLSLSLPVPPPTLPLCLLSSGGSWLSWVRAAGEGGTSSHFPDVETEAQRGDRMCSGSQGQALTDFESHCLPHAVAWRTSGVWESIWIPSSDNPRVLGCLLQVAGLQCFVESNCFLGVCSNADSLQRPECR